MRWACAPSILILASLAQPVVCQEQQVPRDYEQSRMWLSIKQELLSRRGEQYFEQGLKGANIPAGANGLNAFEGMLVSSTPVTQPNTFLVAMPGETTPEITLKLKGKLEKSLPAGTRVSFEGEIKTFTRQPFMLTLEVKTVKRAVLSDEPHYRNQKSK